MFVLIDSSTIRILSSGVHLRDLLPSLYATPPLASGVPKFAALGVSKERGSATLAINISRHLEALGRRNLPDELKRYPLEHSGMKMPWSKAVIAGDFIFLSGTEGRDTKTDDIVPGMKAQCEMALMKIKERLEELGSSLKNLVLLRIYVTDMDKYFRYEGGWVIDRFWKKYCPEFLDSPPSMTLLQVAGLSRKAMEIEIEAIAYSGNGKKRN